MSDKTSEDAVNIGHTIRWGNQSIGTTVKELHSCKTEDEHAFNSMGQCKRCGAHRKPA